MKMRAKTLISMSMLLMVAAFVFVSMPVQAQDPVRIYVWNPANSSNMYPFLLTTAVTYVQVWIESPPEWANTPSGIVGYTASLHVDPVQVEVMSALAMPDTDGDGTNNGFLGQFLSDNFYNFDYATSFLIGTIDKTAGSITGTAEAILGFSTLGVGAGGTGPMFRFAIRTRTGYTLQYSPLDLFNVQYTTVDGVNHTPGTVQKGHYGVEQPEFPFGIGILMALVPAGAVMYLWRTRKKVTKQ